MDIVDFTNRSNGSSKKQKAYLINQYIVVGRDDTENYFQVFNRLQGKPILDVKFSDLDSALKFAEWVINVFGEWMWAWKADPDFDLFAMCKWQSMTALRTFVALSLLENKAIIETQDIKSAWGTSQPKVKEWTRA